MAETWDGWTLRQESIRCGKSRCRGCPHGPYWYGYKTEGGKTKKRYFGKKHPRDNSKFRYQQRYKEQEEAAGFHAHDAIFDKTKRTTRLALEILDLPENCRDWPTILAAYRKHVRWWHPDRGGSVKIMSRLNVAFEHLKERFAPV